MGIDKSTEEYEKKTLSFLGMKYKGLKWCELGNQRTSENEVAKNKYSSLGVEHISLDLNGIMLMLCALPLEYFFSSNE